jgi:hypothetical protein
MSATHATALPDYAPVPPSALGPALNEQGYYAGQNLYPITDSTYRPAFPTNSVGAVLLDAPPTTGNKTQRAADETDRDLLLENNRA